MSIEAMKQALEALEKHKPKISEGSLAWITHDQAITALRTAIEQADDLEAWKTSDTAYRPGGLPQDFTKHEVDSASDWSEWVCPDPTQYFMTCCDCGLVHEMQFNVVKYSAGDTCEDFDDPYVQAVFRARRTTPPAAQPALVQEPVLQEIEQYRLQMAGISTAALGYWKEVDGIHPDYDTPALHDVAKLYAKYDELYKAQGVHHAVIAGALFDFMGWLTTRDERLVLSDADEASPAVDAIRDFAKMRGLSLDDAQVQDWQDNATPPAAQQEHDAYGYAKRLAVAIWEQHYKDVAPQWSPFDDLMGVLTQIDNMTAGLTAQRQPHYDKTEMNCFVQNLYDQKMREGRRGHYETMFHVVHRAIEAAYGIKGNT